MSTRARLGQRADGGEDAPAEGAHQAPLVRHGAALLVGRGAVPLVRRAAAALRPRPRCLLRLRVVCGPGRLRGLIDLDRHRGDLGLVTAETAVAFPALVVVLAVALWGVSAAAAQVACVDAARAGARAAARGEPETEVRAAVLRAAPPNARVTVSRDPATTKVVVEAVARPPLKTLFPALRLQAQAVAATEPTGGDASIP